MEATFKVHKKWTEDEVVARTAEVIGFDDYCPPWTQESGHKWVLNASNDWWLDFCGPWCTPIGIEADYFSYKIAGRYADQKLVDALTVVLEYIFR